MASDEAMAWTKLWKRKAAFAEAMAAKVELQGIEPWSKHIHHKLSTCLFVH
jgi:hypothetical protein